MKQHTQKKVLTNVLTSITCDSCHTIIEGDELLNHDYISISYTGGYGSILGDGTKYDIDLCESCFKEKFKNIANITTNYF